MTDRIDAIRKLLDEDPSDVFLHYSLAMECVVADRTDEALAAFEACRTLDPNYVPAYVEAGKCARAAGQTDLARGLFQAALELAKSAGDGHVVDSLTQQLESLG